MFQILKNEVMKNEGQKDLKNKFGIFHYILEYQRQPQENTFAMVSFLVKSQALI